MYYHQAATKPFYSNGGHIYLSKYASWLGQYALSFVNLPFSWIVFRYDRSQRNCAGSTQMRLLYSTDNHSSYTFVRPRMNKAHRKLKFWNPRPGNHQTWHWQQHVVTTCNPVCRQRRLNTETSNDNRIQIQPIIQSPDLFRRWCNHIMQRTRNNDLPTHDTSCLCHHPFSYSFYLHHFAFRNSNPWLICRLPKHW